MQPITTLPENLTLEDMQKAVVDAIEDIKGFDIKVMDVRKLTSITSTMVIASGTSNRQTRAIAHNVREKLKEMGAHINGVEGEKEGEWVLVDMGEIIVHIMQQTTRDYYNLEQLWGAAESSRQTKSKVKTA
jgi:ribosome-associated protein